MNNIEAGSVIDVRFPFYRDTKDIPDYCEDGPGYEAVECWIPGTRSEPSSPEDVIAVADGVGFMRLTIISRHKPGKYPERVFYVRQWVDPGGKVFGKTCLRIKSFQAFKKMASGHSYEYIMSEAL